MLTTGYWAGQGGELSLFTCTVMKCSCLRTVFSGNFRRDQCVFDSNQKTHMEGNEIHKIKSIIGANLGRRLSSVNKHTKGTAGGSTMC